MKGKTERHTEQGSRPNNIRELLERRVKASPDKYFLFSEADGRRYTYAEFDAAVNRAARMLASRGIKKGDAVSLLLPNGAEYIIAYFACFKLGALAGPINSLLKSEEITYVIANSEARALLINSDFLSEVEAIRRQLPDLKHLIVFDDERNATAEFTEGDLPDALVEKDDEAIIIYTSGTTGKP
ncbi:MAG TPA: AMP-binding protein, partial [Pyrinomonadaceae bacterium]|nr:AMP-binding protein [Pyrinomonadaceae bacterium]